MNNPWYGYSASPDAQLLFQRIQELEQRLEQSIQRTEQLEKELAELRSKPPIHVEYHFDQLKVSRLDGTLNIGLSPQAMKDIESFEVPAPGMWAEPSSPSSPSSPASPTDAPTGAPIGAPTGAPTGSLAGSPFFQPTGSPAGSTGMAPGGQMTTEIPFVQGAGTADQAGRIRRLQQEADDDLARNGHELVDRLGGQLQVEIDAEHRRLMVDDIRSQLNRRVQHYGRAVPYPANGSDEEMRAWERTVLDKTMKDVRIAITNYLRNFRRPDAGQETSG